MLLYQSSKLANLFGSFVIEVNVSFGIQQIKLEEEYCTVKSKKRISKFSKNKLLQYCAHTTHRERKRFYNFHVHLAHGDRKKRRKSCKKNSKLKTSQPRPRFVFLFLYVPEKNDLPHFQLKRMTLNSLQQTTIQTAPCGRELLSISFCCLSLARLS